MCGIFGILSSSSILKQDILFMGKEVERRGKDSSGIFFSNGAGYNVVRSSSKKITDLLKGLSCKSLTVLIGHARLATNGFDDCQPVCTQNVTVVHNGIILNHDKLWLELEVERQHEIDSEVICAVAEQELSKGTSIEAIPEIVLQKCEGSISAALIFPLLGKIALFSNNGSLQIGRKNGDIFFASEYSTLDRIGCHPITQIKEGNSAVLSIHSGEVLNISQCDEPSRLSKPSGLTESQESALLMFPNFELKRCTKCILPESMPFIKFDEEGICNFCRNHKIKVAQKPISELVNQINRYRRPDGYDCIIPLSGGRDSSYVLHIAINELGLKPITYTYDWGMVTDLGRRNISRMCASLGVENILFAADIGKKRDNIRRNLMAWLKAPDMGMLNILTAGDKHFFKYINDIRYSTGIKLNLWGVNPLETTFFKSGFLGVKPDFGQTNVYSSGALKQIRYQAMRARSIAKNPRYINGSLWDTITGEYYRSFQKKKDYFHIFDYWAWNEQDVESVLESYQWEKASDTKSSWRIGDGSAAFYNYVYYIFAGFTEHDTFRSNQIREGHLGREEALLLVNGENRPRYANIKWYLEALGLEFGSSINVVNSMHGKGINRDCVT